MSTLYYITFARMPTERAHGYQIAKTCEALGRLGTRVVLRVPERDRKAASDLFTYYSVEKTFTVEYVPIRDWVTKPRWGKLGFLFSVVSFIRGSSQLSLPKDTAVYTRTPLVAWYYAWKGYAVCFEAHTMPTATWKQRMVSWLVRRVRGIVCVSEALQEIFKKNTRSLVTVVRNGTDIPDRVDLSSQDRIAIRRLLRVPEDAYIAIYVGSLAAWKGIETVLSAAQRASSDIPSNIWFVCVGGSAEEVKQLEQRCQREHITNVRCVGHVEHTRAMQYLTCADVAVLPNIPLGMEAQSFTSPIKLFEYLAHRVPVVASDIPAIREIVPGAIVEYVEPGDGVQLYDAVQFLCMHPADAQVRRDAGYTYVQQFRWESRANAILDFMREIV